MIPTHRISLIAILILATSAFIAAGCTDDSDDEPSQVAAQGADESSDDAEGGGDEPSGDPVNQAEVCQEFAEVAPESTGDQAYAEAPPMVIGAEDTFDVKITTNKGTMDATIDASMGPLAANNFMFLTCEGFYDGTSVHRIVEGFMFQGGDPDGTGAGGPGYAIDNDDVASDYERGVLAMANAGPDTGGSQFFVMFADYPLPPDYSQFGRITEGFEAVDAIESTPVVAGASGEESSPTEDVTIESIELA